MDIGEKLNMLRTRWIVSISAGPLRNWEITVMDYDHAWRGKGDTLEQAYQAVLPKIPKKPGDRPDSP